MRSRVTVWYECKAMVAEMQEDGTAKPVAKQYIVDATSCMEAEESMAEELSTLYQNGFEIVSLKKSSYSEIFFSDKETDDYWYKAKLQYITIDEKTDKEKRTNVTHLIQAHSFSQAVEYVHEVMKGAMIDYTIHTLQETVIEDVLEHNKISDKKEATNDKPEYEEEDNAQ